MTVAQTRAAIQALPAMTACRTDGEWRVTITGAALAQRFPRRAPAWCQRKQEALAYYTEDAADALDTARAMSAHWEAAR